MGPAEVQEELDAYDGSLAYLDHQVGRLLAGLEQRGLRDRTLIVITADHGEEFQEHRVFEHGYSLYRPAVQVPLLVALPAAVPGGRRVTAPVSLRDLPATVVDLVGIGGGSPFPGQSLRRLWGQGDPAGAPLLSEVDRVTGHPAWFPVSQGDLRSILFEGRRYIRRSDGAEELYDFAQDPWERHDLARVEGNQLLLGRYRALLDSAAAGGGR